MTLPISLMTVTAAGPGSITGRVTVAGEPVTDALVQLVLFGQEIANVPTDANGVYTATGLDEGTYLVQAISPTAGLRIHPSAYSQDDATLIVLSAESPAATGVDIEMPPGEVSGTVTFRGAPLPGATVQLRANYGGLNGTMPGTTDANGRYRIRGVDPNTFGVVVTVGGTHHLAADVTVSSAAQVVTGQDFVVPSGVISGTVTDGAGQPLVDGKVFVSAGFDRRYQAEVTDGTFEVTGLADGSYTVSAAQNGSTRTSLSAPVVIGAGSYDVTGLALQLPSPGRISGTVTGPGRQFARISAISTDGAFIRRGSTDGLGNYTIGGLPEADYVVRADVNGPQFGVSMFHPGVKDQSMATVVHVSAGAEVTGVDIAAPDSASWLGTITTSDGSPVAGASVFLFVRDGTTSMPIDQVVTDDVGAFSFGELPSGQPLTFAVLPPGAPFTSMRFLGGASDVTAAQAVVLEPGETHVQGETVWAPTSISGFVTTDAGDPVDGVAYAFNDQVGWVSATISGGAYEIAAVTPGTYKVYVVPGFEPTPYAPRYYGDTDVAAQAQLVPVLEGASVQNVDVVVVPGATVRGTVTVANGQPVHNATVIPHGVDIPPFAYLPGLGTSTQPDGTFEMTGLPSGSMTVEVQPPVDSGLLTEWSGGSATAAGAQVLTLTAGATVQSDLVLDRGVFGRLATTYAQGPAVIGSSYVDAPIAFCPAEALTPDILRCFDNGSPRGRFAPGGNWFLVGPAAVGRHYVGRPFLSFEGTESGGAPLSPTAGASFDCVIPLDDTQGPAFCEDAPPAAAGAISGRVVGRDGLGVGGVDVSLTYPVFGQSRVMPTTVTTDADGYYTMPAVPVGTYTVLFTPPYTRPDLQSAPWTPSGSSSATEATPLQVSAGATTTGISLTYDPTVSGSAVITEGGVELGEAFARVVALCPTPGEYLGNFFTCSDGRAATLAFWNGTGYFFPTVKPGMYSVRGAEVFTGRLGAATTMTLNSSDSFSCTLPIEPDAVATCDVVSANDDADGVSSTVENAAPNGGDGNGDGLLDSTQPDVTSVADPALMSGAGADYLTLAVQQPSTGPVYALANVSVASPPADSPPPSGATPQTSLIGFDITDLPVPPEGATTGTTASIDVLLPSPANSYFKFEQGTRQWTDATSLATFHPGPELIGGVERWRVTLSIVDNGFGDTNPTFGVITDPGVFAQRSTDLTPPSISAQVVPAAPDGSNGWYRSAVHVDWTVTEDESPGTLSAVGCDDLDVVTDQATLVHTCTATSAGGIAAPVSVTIRRDATAPTIEWTGGPTDGSSPVFGSVPAAPTCAAVDSLSGPDTCTVTGYSSSVGSHVLTATATDLAGNVATAQRAYTVTPWTITGFKQPVDMGNVWNTVRSGSTVPLKFELFQGTTRLTDVASIRSLTSAAVSCAIGFTAEDAIETTVSSAAALRYDAASGQFIQNWATPKSPGTCRRVTLVTQDGSTIVAYFKLK